MSSYRKITNSVVTIAATFIIFFSCSAKDIHNTSTQELRKNTSNEINNTEIDSLTGIPISKDLTLGAKKKINMASIIIEINSLDDIGVYMFGIHLNNIIHDNTSPTNESYSGTISVYDIIANELVEVINLEDYTKTYSNSKNQFDKYGDGIGFHIELSKKTQYLIIPNIFTKRIATDNYTLSIEKKNFVK